MVRGGRNTWWDRILDARHALRSGDLPGAIDACEGALRALDDLLCSAPPCPALIRARLGTLRDRALLLGACSDPRAEAAHQVARAFAQAVRGEPALGADLRRSACLVGRQLAAVRRRVPAAPECPSAAGDPTPPRDPTPGRAP